MSYNAGLGSIYYVPDSNFSGSDSLWYVVRDDSGSFGDTTLVVLVVNGVNDPPVGVMDVVYTPEDESVDILVGSNDYDVDGSVIVGSAAVVVLPVYGSVVVSGGVLTYTPGLNYNGLDSLWYVIYDDEGLVSDSTLVLITVADSADVPVAVDDSYTGYEDTGMWLAILANDYDVDGVIDSSSVSLVVGVSHGVLSWDGGVSQYWYVPDSNYSGIDSFVYYVLDDAGYASNSAVVLLDIGELNDRPDAVNDSVLVYEDALSVIYILANDVDLDGDLNASSVLLITAPVHGSVGIHPVLGELSYVSDANYVGLDSLSYVVYDDSGSVSDTAWVTDHGIGC